MTKDLFVKYLQGNCTEAEFEQLIAWFKEDSLSTNGREMIREIWKEYETSAAPSAKVKYNRMLDKIHHEINIKQNPQLSTIHKASFVKRILTIMTRAAAILLLPVLSLLFYTNLLDKNQYAENFGDIELEAPAGSRMQVELGDGTKVWLNHGSKLKYPYRFDGKSRKVFLIGEAYFEVAHNKAAPFIVATDKLQVKAVGTAFNVNACPGEDIVETTLVDGRVILYDKNGNREIEALSPNECLKFNPEKNKYTIETENTAKYVAWKDGILVFKNDGIADIAKKMAKWYNVEVEITNDKVKKFTFTATFTDETLPQVLDLLTLAAPVSYQLTKREKLPDGTFTKQRVVIGLKK